MTTFTRLQAVQITVTVCGFAIAIWQLRRSIAGRSRDPGGVPVPHDHAMVGHLRPYVLTTEKHRGFDPWKPLSRFVTQVETAAQPPSRIRL